MKNIKKIFMLISLFILFFSIMPMTTVNAETSFKSYQAQVEELGITIPDGIRQSKLCEVICKNFLKDAYAGRVIDRDSPMFNSFYSEIYSKLKPNWSIILKNESPMSITPLSSYVLQDNYCYNSWSDSYLNYNCYGYGIGRYRRIDPGYYSGRTFIATSDPSKVAAIIAADMKALGYNNTWISKNKPNAKPVIGNVICVETSWCGYYHIMKAGSSLNNWTHKNGGTIPLTWKYTSPTYKPYNGEVVGKYGPSQGNPETDNYNNCYFVHFEKTTTDTPTIFDDFELN